MYNDEKYIRDYLKTGKFPKIHDDIWREISGTHVCGDSVADIGCCYGLLSVRCAQIAKHVVGIEANEKYLAKAIQHPRVDYVPMTITLDTVPDLEKVFEQYKVDTVVMRRVVPELYDTGGYELIEELSKMFKRRDILRIILEGRIESSRSTHPLKNVVEEWKLFEDRFEFCGSYKNVITLRHQFKEEEKGNGNLKRLYITCL